MSGRSVFLAMLTGYQYLVHISSTKNRQNALFNSGEEGRMVVEIFCPNLHDRNVLNVRIDCKD